MLDIDTALPEGLCENEYLEGATQEVEAEMSEEAPKNDFNELELLRQEVEGLRNQLSERDRLDKAGARMNSELERFYEYFPTASLDEVPEEIWERVRRGSSLSAEFSLHLLKMEREQKSVSEINKKNRQMSAGALGASEGERYYSPSEVKKMSPAQVKAHYDDIIESMRHWN